MNRRGLWASYFFAYGALGIFLPFVSLFLKSHGWGLSEVSLAMAVIPVFRIVSPPLFGWLVDRTRSSLPWIRVLSVFAILASLGMPLVESTPALFACLLVHGIAQGSLFPLIDSLCLRSLGGASEKYGEIRSGGSVGFLVAVVAGGFLWESLGLRAAPFGVGILLLGVLLASLDLVEPAWVDPRHPELSEVRELISKRPLLLLLAVAFLHEFAISGFDLYYSVHVEALGHPTQVTGLGWGLGVGLEIVLLSQSARWLAWVGSSHSIRIGIGLSALRWFATASATSALALIAIQALHAFTFGAWFLGTVRSLDLLSGPRLKATAQGVLFGVIFGVGVACGARTWGYVLSQYGSRAAFAGMGAMDLLAFLVASQLVDPKRSP